MSRKKYFTVLAISLTTLILCGCRLTPIKPAKSEVEAIAKQCINDAVEMENSRPHKMKVYAEVFYEYPFVDERGIEFNVIAATGNTGFVEPSPWLFSSELEYRTDYKEKVFEYYRDEIEQILDEADILEYKITGQNGLIIKVAKDADFQDLNERLSGIDELLNYSYKYNAVTHEKLSAKSHWKGFCSWDVLVRVQDDEQYSLIFSDGNEHELNLL